jgi:hypothetical protein
MKVVVLHHQVAQVVEEQQRLRMQDGNKYKCPLSYNNMNKHLQNYLHSFKNYKLITKVLLYDLLFWLATLAGFSALFFNLSKKIAQFGATPQELQNIILQDPVKAQEIFAQLSSFLLTFSVGIIFILIGTLLLYSYTRKKIWNTISKHKTKYKRWNGVNLLLPIIYIILAILFALIMLIVRLITTKLSIQIILFINNLVLILFVIFLLIFTFLIYYNFNKSYKVFKAIGDTFNLIKVRWYRLWRAALLITATTIIFSILQSFLKKQLIFHQTIYIIIAALLFLLFIAWARVYLIQTIKN